MLSTPPRRTRFLTLVSTVSICFAIVCSGCDSAETEVTMDPQTAADLNAERMARDLADFKNDMGDDSIDDAQIEAMTADDSAVPE